MENFLLFRSCRRIYELPTLFTCFYAYPICLVGLESYGLVEFFCLGLVLWFCTLSGSRTATSVPKCPRRHARTLGTLGMV